MKLNGSQIAAMSGCAAGMLVSSVFFGPPIDHPAFVSFNIAIVVIGVLGMLLAYHIEKDKS